MGCGFDSHGVYHMPYTKKDTQSDPSRGSWPANNSGELNYQISRLLNAYMNEHGVSYDRLKDCTSACEEAGAEFRRRFMVPYEEEKIIENGDVYDGVLLTEI